MLWVVLVLASLILLWVIFNKPKRDKIEIQYISTGDYEKRPVDNWQSLVDPNIGVDTAVCPYCSSKLDKFPARKTKCKGCGNDIYKRTRAYDGKSILIKEDEIELVEIDYAKKFGDYEEYLERKATCDTPDDDFYDYEDEEDDEPTYSENGIISLVILVDKSGNAAEYENHFTVAQIREKFRDKSFIWYPSDSVDPSPSHQLKYGKRYKITSKIELPGQNTKCRCGMRISV